MHSVVAVGSSIFEGFRMMQEMVPGGWLVNRAVGGTTAAWWASHLCDVLHEAPPDVVLFYGGSNDLNDGAGGADVEESVLQCRAAVSRAAPDATFAYFGIIKAPQKNGKWELIDQINASIRSGLGANDLYVESNEVFFRSGAPVFPYFTEDGLHLTDAAYDALIRYARPQITAWLERVLPAR